MSDNREPKALTRDDASKPIRLKVVSDGTRVGTRVFDAETGRAIRGVFKVEITVDAEAISTGRSVVPLVRIEAMLHDAEVEIERDFVATGVVTLDALDEQRKRLKERLGTLPSREPLVPPKTHSDSAKVILDGREIARSTDG